MSIRSQEALLIFLKPLIYIKIITIFASRKENRNE